MSARKSLLIELGCEELPPRALDDLTAAFAAGICKGLADAGIGADLDAARAYSTPRRLAVHVPAVAGGQPEQNIERRGPSVEAGLDADGKPGKALLGFARSCGVEPDALERMPTDKGEWFVYRATQPGQPLAELLPGILDAAVRKLPIPRPMRWGDHDWQFVRPVHWLVVLHGDQVIDAELMGLRAGRQTRGHRFHHPGPVHVADADSWVEALAAAQVTADPADRRALIEQRCQALAEEKELVLSPMDGEALMRELVNITEWPVPVLCRFDDEYLGLPGEVLRTTMELDQRFLATANREDGKLSPWFFGIANIDSLDPAQIRQGYERVIRPRFADARFFYHEDLKTPLADGQAQLRQVTYQKALGSMWDKCTRVAELARVIANRAGVDAGLATHAASLSKCDLVTRMVGEFPELQGVMGYYYAREQGEPLEVARALSEFYMPRQSGDRIAEGALARVLAVAERLDTLAGIFWVGMKPGGNKDPFALRRAALGLARTLIEGGIDIDLRASLIEALELQPQAIGSLGFDAAKVGTPAAGLKNPHPPSAPSPASGGRKDPAVTSASAGVAGARGAEDAGPSRAEVAAELYDFIIDRLRGYYADQGIGSNAFEAVLAVQPATLPDFDQRLRAVAGFSRTPQAQSLAAANKRVGNILGKQDTQVLDGEALDPALFESDAESDLARAVAELGRRSSQQCAERDYAAALQTLAALQQPVDRFFEQVLVMADDPALRRNRLLLLADLHSRFMAIADIGRLDV